MTQSEQIYRLDLLTALMGGAVPTSVLDRGKRSGFWELADEAAREVSEWPEWKKYAADRCRRLSKRPC